MATVIVMNYHWFISILTFKLLSYSNSDLMYADEIYRWYKVQHILGPPGCLCKSVLSKSFYHQLINTYICLKGFIMICVKFFELCGQSSAKRSILLQ